MAPAKALTLDAMLAEIDAVVPIVHRKNWTVYKTPDSMRIPTSDAPFRFVPPSDFAGGFLGPSPVDERAGWVFPLTSSCLFRLVGNEGRLRCVNATREEIGELSFPIIDGARRLIIAESAEMVEKLGEIRGRSATT